MGTAGSQTAPLPRAGPIPPWCPHAEAQEMPPPSGDTAGRFRSPALPSPCQRLSPHLEPPDDQQSLDVEFPHVLHDLFHAGLGQSAAEGKGGGVRTTRSSRGWVTAVPPRRSPLTAWCPAWSRRAPASPPRRASPPRGSARSSARFWGWGQPGHPSHKLFGVFGAGALTCPLAKPSKPSFTA